MSKARPLAVFLICLLGIHPAARAQDYEVMQLPTLPGWPSLLPTDINDNAHATGIGFAGFGSMTRAFYFDGTTTHDFTVPLISTVSPQYPYVGTRGLRINNHNHILLTLEVVDLGAFSYIWDGQDFHPFDPPGLPPGAEPAAAALNNHGEVAGVYKLITADPHWTLIYRAIVWDPSTNQTTIIEPPAPYTDSSASDISDTGWVTGFLMGGPLPPRGFIWKDGVMTVLDRIDRMDYLSMSQRINDAGRAGAFSVNQAPAGMPSFSRVILWSDQGVHHIAPPQRNRTGFQVYGINNSDEVVGTMMGPQQPFHFKDGIVRNLNSHIPASLMLDLWDADGINNHGQIIANGQYLGGGDWNNYAFILTPKPAGDSNRPRER